ncbi:hypothetical protein H4R21_004575, partial [Coemansia helicoidea]
MLRGWPSVYAAPAWRQAASGLRLRARVCARSAHSTAASGGERVVFEAVSGRAVRMLKFMSLTGSAIACTATAGALVAQMRGALEDGDLAPASLVAASAVSVASTVILTRMFGPFVTRITLVPPKRGAGVALDSHGLPKFDSMLAAAARPRASAAAAMKPLLSGQVTHDTTLVLESPGLLGYTTRRSRVRVSELVPSAARFRT